MAQSVNVIERDGLRMHVFVSKPVIFTVASIVLEGRKEVALVDAQFSADNAHNLIELIRSTGKPLRTIYISYFDPDYYFGLDAIAREFPDARIFASPETVWMIEATKDDKMAVWAPHLGVNAPARIEVPQSTTADHFTLENRRIEIMHPAGDGRNTWLWIPSARTILGGGCLLDGQHLWLADTPTKNDRDLWRAALDQMQKLGPKCVIPAHFAPAISNLQSTESIDFTRSYLTDFEKVMSEAHTSDEVIARMKELYPGLDGVGNLEMSARVLMGDQKWKVVRAFPAIGRHVEVDFGGKYAFDLDFTDEHSMTYHGLRTPAGERPMTESVRYTATEIAPEVYMVWWTESDRTHVVHVEDFGGGVVYTNIASPDGTFTNLRGTLRRLPAREIGLPDRVRRGPHTPADAARR